MPWHGFHGLGFGGFGLGGFDRVGLWLDRRSLGLGDFSRFRDFGDQCFGFAQWTRWYRQFELLWDQRRRGGSGSGHKRPSPL